MVDSFINIFEEYIFAIIFGILSWASSLQFAKLYPHNVKYGKYVLYLHSLLFILGVFEVFLSCYEPTQLHSIQNNVKNIQILLIFSIPAHFELFITNFIIFQWIKIYFSVGVTEGWLIYYKWIMVFLSVLSFMGLLMSFIIITTFDKYVNLINILMYIVGSYCILMSILFISVAYLLMRRVLKTSNLAGITTDKSVCRRLLGSAVVLSSSYFIQGTIIICTDTNSVFIAYIRWIAVVFKLCTIMIIVNTLLLYSKIIHQRLKNHWRKWAKSNRIWDLNTSSKKRHKKKRIHMRGDTEEIPFDPADIRLIRALSSGTNLNAMSIDNISNIENINTNLNRKVTQRFDKPIFPMGSSTGWNSINNLNDIITDNENDIDEKQNNNENSENNNEENMIGFDTMDKLFDEFILDSDDESDMMDDMDIDDDDNNNNDNDNNNNCDVMTEDEDEDEDENKAIKSNHNSALSSDIKAEAILVDIYENGLNSPSTKQIINDNNESSILKRDSLTKSKSIQDTNRHEFDEHDALVGDQFTDTINSKKTTVKQINSSDSESDDEKDIHFEPGYFKSTSTTLTTLTTLTTHDIDYRKSKEYKNIFNDSNIINGFCNPRFWRYLRKKHSKQINQKALKKFTYSFEKARYEPLLSREYCSITPCSSPRYFNTHFRSTSDQSERLKGTNQKSKFPFSLSPSPNINKFKKAQQTFFGSNININSTEMIATLSIRNEYNKLNKKRKHLENKMEFDISGVAAKLDYWKANQLKHDPKWKNIRRAIKTARVGNKHKLQAKEQLNLITFNSDPINNYKDNENKNKNKNKNKWKNMFGRSGNKEYVMAQHQTLQVQQNTYLGGIDMESSDSNQSLSDAGNTTSSSSSSSSGKYSNSNDNHNTKYKYKKRKLKNVKHKKKISPPNKSKSNIFSVQNSNILNAIRYNKPPIFATNATDSDDTDNETKSNLGTSSLKSFRKLKAISTSSPGKYMRAQSFTPRTPKEPIIEHNKNDTSSDENVNLNETE